MVEPRDPSIDAAFDRLRAEVEPSVDVTAHLSELHLRSERAASNRRRVRALVSAAAIVVIAGGALIWRSGASTTQIETTDPAGVVDTTGDEPCRSQSVLVVFEPSIDPDDLLTGSRQLRELVDDGTIMAVNPLEPDAQVVDALRDDPDGSAAAAVRASAAYRILVAGAWPTERTSELERIPGVIRVDVLPCRGPTPPITTAAPGD